MGAGSTLYRHGRFVQEPTYFQTTREQIVSEDMERNSLWRTSILANCVTRFTTACVPDKQQALVNLNNRQATQLLPNKNYISLSTPANQSKQQIKVETVLMPKERATVNKKVASTPVPATNSESVTEESHLSNTVELKHAGGFASNRKCPNQT